MMRSPSTFFLLAFIINSIGISCGSPPKTRDFLSNFGMSSEDVNNQESNTQSECSSSLALIPGSSYSGNSNPPTRSLIPGVVHPPTEPRLPAIPRSSLAIPMSPPAIPMSPAAIPTSSNASHATLRLIGVELENLKFIRLVPNANPDRRFEIHIYTFPPDGPVYLRGKNHVHRPMPTREQIVLSASNGDIFAIVDEDKTLRGMYAVITGIEKRAKVNMHSLRLMALTQEEIRETPAGRNQRITSNFKSVFVNGFLS